MRVSTLRKDIRKYPDRYLEMIVDLIEDFSKFGFLGRNTLGYFLMLDLSGRQLFCTKKEIIRNPCHEVSLKNESSSTLTYLKNV